MFKSFIAPNLRASAADSDDAYEPLSRAAAVRLRGCVLNVFEVESLRGHRHDAVDPASLRVLVRWAGYDSRCDSWEPAVGGDIDPGLVDEYFENCGEVETLEAARARVGALAALWDELPARDRKAKRARPR